MGTKRIMVIGSVGRGERCGAPDWRRLEEDSTNGQPQPSAQRVTAWIGGHGTEPNEQKTQQWPAKGFRRIPQPLQS
jgi:hypothetical protein